MNRPDLPATDELVAVPDPQCCWAWPDGHLHPSPPLPVVWVDEWVEGAERPCSWKPVEARPCGEVFRWEAADTMDSQPRYFTCCMYAGHEDRHLALIEATHGALLCWEDVVVETI